MKPKPKTYVLACDYCGSENIYSDASAYWDVAAQDWVLSDVNDYTGCSECGDECSIDEIEITQMEADCPIGTKRAILVDEARETEGWGQPKYTGMLVSSGEKYRLQAPVPNAANVGDLVILEKATAWQWKVVEV
jgi:hypothetical protein